MMSAVNQLLLRMRAVDSLLCVGLDPDLNKLPRELREAAGSDEEKILSFLKGVIDAVGPYVCAFKAQKAFFDLLAGGHEVLKEVIRYVHRTQPGVIVIVDCKIGDIDNTMTAYIENLFGTLEADGVVANPYMGDDAILPLAELTDKAIVVLVKTSNANAAIVQDVPLQGGQLLWQYMLDLVVQRWNRGNLIPVLASTSSIDLAATRRQIPDTMPILYAGVGAQGGSYADICHLLNAQGDGVFVNSSRGVLYPSGNGPWREVVASTAAQLQRELNSARRRT